MKFNIRKILKIMWRKSSLFEICKAYFYFIKVIIAFTVKKRKNLLKGRNVSGKLSKKSKSIFSVLIRRKHCSIPNNVKDTKEGGKPQMKI
jgi:hypothetical protein